MKDCCSLIRLIKIKKFDYLLLVMWRNRYRYSVDNINSVSSLEGQFSNINQNSEYKTCPSNFTLWN